ncbi:MAG: hypothetical protein GX295_02255 [Syntrophomonadaceae bacterium]|nr:hypothetical protein [Syntrophomonadaceae bacterium]
MSKIIKSSRLIMRDFVQLSLVPSERNNFPRETEALSETAFSDAEPIFDEEKAQQLLAETEDMVRDLLENARLQAQEIMQKAKTEAEQLKQAAVAEGLQIKEKSREEGFQSGKDQAWKETEQERKAIIAKAEAVLKDAHQKREQLLAEIEPQVIQLVIALSQKVVCRELTVNPDAIRDIAREALARANGTGEMVIKVHESFFEPFKDGLEELTQTEDGYRPFRVEIDNTVEPGGCLVDTGAGYVDAQITNQLGKIAENFKQVNFNG